MTQVQNLLVAYRKEQSLTQERFAELLEIKQGTYCAIETYKKDPSFKLAKKIAQTTGIPIGDLFEQYKV